MFVSWPLLPMASMRVRTERLHPPLRLGRRRAGEPAVSRSSLRNLPSAGRSADSVTTVSWVTTVITCAYYSRVCAWPEGGVLQELAVTLRHGLLSSTPLFSTTDGE